MRKHRTILWGLAAALYAIVFALLLVFDRRTAFFWSYLDGDVSASAVTAAGGLPGILREDPKLFCIALAAGLLLGMAMAVLAVRVHAYWTFGTGKRRVTLSALAVMVLVNVLALCLLGADAFRQNRIYQESRDPVVRIRNMLSAEQRIYHAGGGIIGPDGSVCNYTNSLEAFEQSLEKGAHFVELDFRFTTDGALVCIHKWKKDFIKADGTRVEDAVSLEEFLQGKIRGFFTPMTVEDVARAMRKHPELYIVVDLKGDDIINGYRILAKTYPDLMERMIPQFYHAEQFDYLYGLGYRAMIYTLYRTSAQERAKPQLNAFAMRRMLVGITMGTYRVKDGGVFLRQVLGTRTPVYVHTVDDPALARDLFRQGVSAVYTNVFEA